MTELHQPLREMLQLQDRMNTRVHPEWRSQQFPWYRGIWTECAELLDHHGWKWWKQQHPDMAQIQLEIVDIWHFGLSDLLQQEADLDLLVTSVTAEWQSLPTTHHDMPHCIETLAGACLANQAFSVTAFRDLMVAANFEFEDLHRQYIGKNVLNFFRQDHGYQDGSYRKLWCGREDNEHLSEVIANLAPDETDLQARIYADLVERYKEPESA